MMNHQLLTRLNKKQKRNNESIAKHYLLNRYFFLLSFVIILTHCGYKVNEKENRFLSEKKKNKNSVGLIKKCLSLREAFILDSIKSNYETSTTISENQRRLINSLKKLAIFKNLDYSLFDSINENMG
mgnify:CR=1 FL=1